MHNASPITPAARTDSSDAALLAAVAGGDARAFSELYDRHASAARRRALRYCGSPWDAEEILQESFVSVWVSARTYDAARATVRTWILALVSHRAIDWHQRASRRGYELAIEDVEQQLAAPQVVHLEAEINERAREVRRALRSLPADQRRAVTLSHLGGLSHAEVATLTREPLGTVKGRIRLGYARLQAILGETLDSCALT